MADSALALSLLALGKANQGGGGGTTYTAGEGIAINSDNEISALIDGETIQFNEDGDLTAIGGGSEVSGTNDGTNWTSLTIDDDTYAIPSGGSSLQNIKDSPYDDKSVLIGTVDYNKGGGQYLSDIYSTATGIKTMAAGKGSFTYGQGGSLSNTDTHTGIKASAPGSMAGGYLAGTYPSDGVIQAHANGSFAFGCAQDHVDEISTDQGSEGSLSFGYTNYGNGASIRTKALGSLAFGKAQQRANIYTSGAGSLAGGSCTGMYNGIQAEGEGSIAIGITTAGTDGLVASGKGSQAFGWQTLVNGNYQMGIGKWNVQDNTKAFIIGNGSQGARSNALTVDWNGNLVCNNVPAPPSADGEYDLHCSIVNGEITYSWTARS